MVDGPFSSAAKILPSEQIKDKGNNETQQNAGGQRKVKGKISPVDVDVAWKPAQPWNLVSERKEQSQRNEQDAEENKRLAERGH
jgi:hypothetical protein